MTVNPIPPGYHSVTPYLIIDGAARAIEYYTHAFGATELFRLGAGDSIAHAEIRIGDSNIMLADEQPDCGFLAPKAGGNSISLMIYVEDCDAVFNRAVELGATVREPLDNKFYGDRAGQIADPFGHVWTIATHVEDVPEDELTRRMQAFTESMGGGA